jgi:hypothetical protein
LDCKSDLYRPSADEGRMTTLQKPIRAPRTPQDRRKAASTTKRPSKRAKKPRKPSRAKLRKATKALCDHLWATHVKRDGYCDFGPGGVFEDAHPHECRGSLQAMHGISRRYHSTRWSFMNGFTGCAATHMYFTRREGEWQAFLVRAWGLSTFEEMWAKALAPWDKDIQAVAERLKAETGAK